MDRESKIVLVILVLLVAAIVFILGSVAKRNATLMDQCVEDGHKEYECQYMIIN